MSAEATWPAPLPAESGEANRVDAPAAVPAPQPSDEVSDAATQEARTEIAATPTESVQATAASDVGRSSSGDVVTP